MRGWQCAEDDRGVCDSGVWCDVGGGVDGLLRVCPRAHDEGRYDVSWLFAFWQCSKEHRLSTATSRRGM